MGRPLRPVADGLVYHAINRGNNRDRVFADDGDFRAFLRALAQTQLRYPFALFGYALMSNHFHLVLRPEPGQSISRILQSLTVAHTWRYHRRHHSVGHVWQGRFKSPVIQDDDHLLTVLRYVEANPLRAGMVGDLKEYPWTSYAAHGLGRADPLLREAPVWSGLGATETARQARWRRRVHELLTERELAALRRSVTSGRPYRSDAWAAGMGQLLGLATTPKRRGRPPKRQPAPNEQAKTEKKI
ncbi:MAG TPA: transposase [Gemmataceae bacterium]|nr:transposase [Gemmataceae bacterium]